MPNVAVTAYDLTGNLTKVVLPYTVTAPSRMWPDATNTGVPAGTVLTNSSGLLNITVAGTVIEARNHSGGIVVNAPNVTIKRSRIRSTSPFVLIQNNSTELLIIDCEIDGMNSNTNGISPRNVLVRRCNIHHVENGLNVGGPTIVEDSYIHDLFSGNGGHSDGAQFNQGASDITFRHNNIFGGNTATIIMWDGSGSQNANVLIENNRLDGTASSYTIYTPRTGPLTNVRIRNNRFVRAAFGYNGGNQSLVTEWSGNVNDVTGAPV